MPNRFCFPNPCMKLIHSVLLAFATFFENAKGCISSIQSDKKIFDRQRKLDDLVADSIMN